MRLLLTLSLAIAIFAADAGHSTRAREVGTALEFHTFSIIAVDPATKETGVAVTTRNPCVGNAVPWVRAGVGAVATQGGTRVEYGRRAARSAGERRLAEGGARSLRRRGCRIAIAGRSA